MPAKPFKIEKAPPPPKTTTALARERKLSAEEQSAIKRFASSIRIASAKAGHASFKIQIASAKPAFHKSSPKPRLVKGRAIARKK